MRSMTRRVAARLGFRAHLLSSLVLILLPPCSTAGELPYSLRELFDPSQVSELTVHRLTGGRTDPPNFHGFGIVDSATTGDAGLIGAFLLELQYELAHPRPGVTLCFYPRHALSVAVGSGSYDFLICYECRNVEIYRDSERIAAGSIAALSEGKLDHLFRESGL